MTHEKTAHAFFDACETGKGWETCRQYCAEDATFSCQADALADVTSLSAYTDWVKGLLGPIPDGHYEMTAFAFDQTRGVAVGAAVFKGTQTGDGGPVPPTGKSVSSDYVYVIDFAGDKISHMTKIWNDQQALRALGWA